MKNFSKRDKIPIGYCGQKAREIDHLYGTGLVWVKDEQTIHRVSPDKAALLLRHPDVYFDARAELEIEEKPLASVQPPNRMMTESLPVEALGLPRNFEEMDKAALTQLGLRLFNMRFDDDEPDDQIRAAIRQGVDRMRFDEPDKP